MSAADFRSVGELLLDSELIARDVLMDVDQMGGRTMVRTWGELVQSAGDLWQALPKTARNPLGGDAVEPDDTYMEQLQGITRTMLRTRAERWPGDGPADSRLLRISENLLKARELVTHQRSDVRPMRAEVREDLLAAKSRLMHTLYVASHGVNVALRQDIRTLEGIQADRRVIAAPESLTRSRAAFARVSAFEQLAGSYVARTYPGALGGEHKPKPSGSRLGQALACFDVQVHRTLSANARGADLIVTAQSQALIMLAGHTLLRAGAETGAVDPSQYRSRLSPALEDAQNSWAAMSSTWRVLTPPSARRPDRDLGHAASEARAAIMEIIHDRATLASPTVMADRVDLAATARTIQDALSAAVDQAHLVHTVIREPTLNGSARAVNAMAMGIVKDRPPGGPGTSEQPWVSPRDLLGNRLVPLPEPVREAIHAATAQTVQTVTRAMSAAAFLHHLSVGNPDETDPTVRGPVRDKTPLPRLHANSPNRCEPRP